MSELTANQLARVNSFPKLIQLLRDHLEWPLEDDCGIEDVTFEYEPHELGLKPEETAKIREIHQLRPLKTDQPWGVFFLSLEDKAISVTVLRRMLKALVVKKRAGSQAAERASWDKEDLIFAANFGKSGERELAFVHFSDAVSTGDLPVMKVLGWNAKDTKLHNQHVATQLKSRLTWPDDPTDLIGWRGQWAGAFETGHNEVIRTSKELAVRLASLAGDIRARANQLLDAEDDSGPMRTMLEAFRKNLIQDLDADGFADMFAQTICYGMLAARISRPGADLVADNLADMVPRTNPFLKELFANFLKLGGRDKRSGLDFDELGVRDVVDMLNRAKMDAVLRDFGDRNPKEDPVIHFYELFLKEYDPEKRMQRGVFYTPRPVVNFIVRGVDEILRTEFDLPLGLADTSTWAELAERNDAITIPDHVESDAPFVQILDPATGTGTFLVEVIDLIHKRMVEHWQSEGVSKADIVERWNEYVPGHLLPRLTAFELMMAPYTIAHMKVGLKLSETGYTFGSDVRANIFLTNALEPARDLAMEFDFVSEALAHEAGAANMAKNETPFTTVIGNPPYSLRSGNMTPRSRRLVERYKELDGKKIEERGALQFEKNIQDDYVKFIAFCENSINKSEFGVCSLITNHSYIDNLTFIGMRKSLLDTFNILEVIDFKGNIKRGSGAEDKNLFEIQQGVAIFRGSKLTRSKAGISLRVGSVTGTLDHKNEILSRNFQDLCRETEISSDGYYFFPHRDGQNEIRKFDRISEIFDQRSAGIITARDHVATAISAGDLSSLVDRIADFTGSRKELIEEFRLNDKRGWGVENTQRAMSLKNKEKYIKPFLYRPFDIRSVFYHKDVVWGMANPTFQHSTPSMQNLFLLTTRKVEVGDFAHAYVSSGIAECHSVSLKEINYALPLFLKPSVGESHRRPNIDRNYALTFSKALSLAYEDGIPRGDAQSSLGKDIIPPRAEQLSLETAIWDGRGDLAKDFGPRDLFDYIYAVLHAPSYRSRYAEFLKSDFPRIPTPAGLKLFKSLAPLGRDLVGLHLLKANEAKILQDPEIRYAGTGAARVEKGYPQYKNGKVMINASRWFEDVPKDTWAFHIGGYQVCEKWLKDRAGKGGKNPSEGRILAHEDILHYRRTVTALTETRRIMAEIDNVIEENGGWPGAFKTDETTESLEQ